MMYNIQVTKDNVHIENSVLYSKIYFRTILERIKKEHPGCVVFARRSVFSLEMEWTTHNFLYVLGLWRDRTKDVDLNMLNMFVRWLYCLLGVSCWLFIK